MTRRRRRKRRTSLAFVTLTTFARYLINRVLPSSLTKALFSLRAVLYCVIKGSVHTHTHHKHSHSDSDRQTAKHTRWLSNRQPFVPPMFANVYLSKWQRQHTHIQTFSTWQLVDSLVAWLGDEAALEISCCCYLLSTCIHRRLCVCWRCWALATW